MSCPEVGSSSRKGLGPISATTGSTAASSPGLPWRSAQWTVQRGVEELYAAYRQHGLTADDFASRLVRISQIKRLVAEGRLDNNLQRIPG